MLDFQLEAKFSAEVCFSNSMNQVLSSERLRDTSRVDKRHLPPCGWFLFALVSEKAYQDSWETYENVFLDAQICELTNWHEEANRLASCEDQVRCAASAAPIACETFYQRPHPLTSLVTAIHEAGFPFVEVARLRAEAAISARIAVLAKSYPNSAVVNTRRPTD